MTDRRVMYRYHATFYGFEVRIVLRELPIKRETTCGAWVLDGFRERFVKYGTRKQYASKTPEEALESFKKKKERHLSILKAQHDRIERILDMLELGIMKETQWENTMRKMEILGNGKPR